MFRFPHPKSIGDATVNKFRRTFLARAGLLGAAALGSGALGVGQSEAGATLITSYGPKGHRARVTDLDIGNFALNLEYLEAEFYLNAVTGTGLAATEITGVGDNGKAGTPGAVTGGGRAVPFAVKAVQDYATQIAQDEHAHVLDLRAVLGKHAVARPAIDIGPAFTAAAVAAGVIPAGQTFDPYANDDNFLLAAFIFEDVGVTAYHGAAPFIRSSSILTAASGILAVEAYHASNIRTTLAARSEANPALVATANKISALRATADGNAAENGHETPLTDANGKFTVVAADPATGIAYARTFEEVLAIVYLGKPAGAGGGFLPQGANGLIR